MIFFFDLLLQTCVCANRIYVQDRIYTEFSQKLAAKIDQLVVGDGLDPGVTQGPLINDKAVEKVSRSTLALKTRHFILKTLF